MWDFVSGTQYKIYYYGLYKDERKKLNNPTNVINLKFRLSSGKLELYKQELLNSHQQQHADSYCLQRLASQTSHFHKTGHSINKIHHVTKQSMFQTNQSDLTLFT
jgi:hypothetical protein